MQLRRYAARQQARKVVLGMRACNTLRATLRVSRLER